MPCRVIDAHEVLNSNYMASQALQMNPQDEENFDKLIPKEDMEKHQYILASSGSGKSELIKALYIRQVLEAESSIVIIDPHGDLATQCAMIIENKRRVVYIDPSLKNGITPTINPFRLKKVNEENISITAQELVNALESIIGTDFSPNMESLLIPCVYTLLRKKDSGLNELLRFMDDEINDDLIALGMNSPIPIHSSFFKNQFSKTKFTVTKNAIETKLQLLLNNPLFSNFILGDNTINLEKEINTKGKIIIVRLPKDKMRKTLAPAAKLIIALIQSIVLKRANLQKEDRPKTYLILDEFQNFYSNTLKEMLAESRKNHLSLVCAHQTLSQIDTITRDMVMSNAYVKIIGKNSTKDLNVMSDEIDVDIKLLKQLNIGEFFIKVGSAEAFKITTTDKYLGNKFAVEADIWKRHLKYQIKHYYKNTVSEMHKEVSSQFKDEGLPPPPNFNEEN